MFKGNKKFDKLLAELKDFQSNLTIHTDRLNGAKTLIAQDSELLDEYLAEQVAATASSKGSFEELKILQQYIDDITSDIDRQRSVATKLEAAIDLLKDHKTATSVSLRGVMTQIMNKEKLRLEFEEGTKILDSFIELSDNFYREVALTASEANLRPFNEDPLRFSIMHSFNFCKFLRHGGIPVPETIMRDTKAKEDEYCREKIESKRGEV